MDGPALLQTISFLAVVALIVVTGCIVLVLESGSHSSRTTQEAATPSDEPGEATTPEREAA